MDSGNSSSRIGIVIEFMTSPGGKKRSPTPVRRKSEPSEKGGREGGREGGRKGGREGGPREGNEYATIKINVIMRNLVLFQFHSVSKTHSLGLRLIHHSQPKGSLHQHLQKLSMLLAQTLCVPLRRQ
jgi:hypothetical protein